MLKDIINANPKNKAIVIDYVSKKCPEAGEYVSVEDDGLRRIVFSPHIFKVPSEKPDVSLVSVMTPFTPSLMEAFKSIKNAASDSGFECLRAERLRRLTPSVQASV